MKTTVLSVVWGVMLIALVSGTAVAVQILATVDCSGDGAARCDGSSGNDDITGDTTRDNIRALGGEDTVIANAGNDRVGGNRDDDFIDGGDGDDELKGGKGNDTINDFPTTTITTTTNGLAGNGPQLDDTDMVFGGRGNDRIDVNDQDGNDSVDCGDDIDTVFSDEGDTETECESVNP